MCSYVHVQVCGVILQHSLILVVKMRKIDINTSKPVIRSDKLIPLLGLLQISLL